MSEFVTLVKAHGYDGRTVRRLQIDPSSHIRGNRRSDTPPRIPGQMHKNRSKLGTLTTCAAELRHRISLTHFERFSCSLGLGSDARGAHGLYLLHRERPAKSHGVGVASYPVQLHRRNQAGSLERSRATVLSSGQQCGRRRHEGLHGGTGHRIRTRPRRDRRIPFAAASRVDEVCFRLQRHLERYAFLASCNESTHGHCVETQNEGSILLVLVYGHRCAEDGDGTRLRAGGTNRPDRVLQAV
jgi:hypothetical protein